MGGNECGEREPVTGSPFVLSVAPDGWRPRYDRFFEALSVRRRRYVLYFLEREEPASISGVARHIAAWEADVPPETLDDRSEATRRALLSLYHTHLPKLVDLRLVEYDRRSGDIRFRDCPELLLEVIALCRPHELPDPAFDPDRP